MHHIWSAGSGQRESVGPESLSLTAVTHTLKTLHTEPLWTHWPPPLNSHALMPLETADFYSSFFLQWNKKIKKVIATFYLTIPAFFTFLSLYLTIIAFFTIVKKVVIMRYKLSIARYDLARYKYRILTFSLEFQVCISQPSFSQRILSLHLAIQFFTELQDIISELQEKSMNWDKKSNYLFFYYFFVMKAKKKKKSEM